MIMNKRYVKVFVLYALCNVIPQLLTRSFKAKKSLPQILLGYTLFALGLKYMTYLKMDKK
ncbi:hypothetical protein RCL10_08915 [Staphylococcus lloydii]|uniref:hypothetical protein n=1 Tax=Staphylococcus lloydii TaxID=2781774 RepID=UPI002927A495|nr:hypothetical protein [Staphylococcus lloydii]MDU9418627.1 hypothetical protein [Staphylococcus lloydii]